MKKSIILLFLILLIVRFSAFAFDLRSKIVLIYSGPGACSSCPEAIGRILIKNGFSIQYIKPGQLTKLKFSNAALYIQPGGTDRPNDILEALKPAEIQNLKDFVYSGGRYLGICSGGYLAGKYVTDDKKSRAFGLLPIDVDEEQEDAKPKLESILWKNSALSVYFQDAPSFNTNLLPHAEVWATYRKTGHGAALINNFGKGRVGVIGPHLEAIQDWFDDDNLIAPPPSYDLLLEFVTSLLKT